MPFILHEGPAWVIREALATHPAVRALAILDGLQPVQVAPAPVAPAEPQAAAAEAPAAPPADAPPARPRKAAK